MSKDPDFRAEFKKLVTDNASPLLPEELARIIRETPRDPEIIETVEEIVRASIRCRCAKMTRMADLTRRS